MMTAQEKRGRVLYLVVATPVVLMQLARLALTTAEFLADSPVKAADGFIRPVAVLAVLGILFWKGDPSTRWLAGFYVLANGGLSVVAGVQVLVKLAARTPAKAAHVFMLVGVPVGGLVVYGLLFALAGALVLWSPSMTAFFRYQREGPSPWIDPEPSGPED